MQERSEAERRAITAPAAGFDEDRPRRAGVLLKDEGRVNYFFKL